MKSRALRFALHALFVGVVAAAAYVVWQKNSEGTAAAHAARAFDQRANAVSRSLLEIKGAQSGYVAAGQGEDYWVARVDSLIGSVRDGLAALETMTRRPQSLGEIASAAAAFEDFEQMDRRARDYARGGQRLLASDLVFSDGIGKMDAAVAALDRARTSERAAAEDAVAQTRRSELMAAGGAAIAGLLIVFLLVPLPRQEPVAQPAKEITREGAPAIEAPGRKLAPAVGTSRPVPSRTPQPARPKPQPPGVDVAGIAALCTDLARVIDTQALPPALERAARLLNASGLVIWVADPDGRELTAVIAHGYPQNVVSRLGTIARDAENATAAAFRTGVLQTVKSDAVSHGAIAAPLVTPAGPVGVMAAEVLNDGERNEATRAAAAIVAAQLATLVGPPSVRAQGKSEAV